MITFDLDPLLDEPLFRPIGPARNIFGRHDWKNYAQDLEKFTDALVKSERAGFERIQQVLNIVRFGNQ